MDVRILSVSSGCFVFVAGCSGCEAWWVGYLAGVVLVGVVHGVVGVNDGVGRVTGVVRACWGWGPAWLSVFCVYFCLCIT